MDLEIVKGSSVVVEDDIIFVETSICSCEELLGSLVEESDRGIKVRILEFIVDEVVSSVGFSDIDIGLVDSEIVKASSEFVEDDTISVDIPTGFIEKMLVCTRSETFRVDSISIFVINNELALEEVVDRLLLIILVVWNSVVGVDSIIEFNVVLSVSVECLKVDVWYCEESSTLLYV